MSTPDFTYRTRRYALSTAIVEDYRGTEAEELLDELRRTIKTQDGVGDVNLGRFEIRVKCAAWIVVTDELDQHVRGAVAKAAEARRRSNGTFILFPCRSDEKQPTVSMVDWAS